MRKVINIANLEIIINSEKEIYFQELKKYTNYTQKTLII